MTHVQIIIIDVCVEVSWACEIYEIQFNDLVFVRIDSLIEIDLIWRFGFHFVKHILLLE